MRATDKTGLPLGVGYHHLQTHVDGRGSFTEVFREEWELGMRPVQWNIVSSEPGVLRGVHVHLRHDDYLLVPGGRATIGLRDLRRGSPTEGSATVVELWGDDLAAITIPHGVAHGFYFHEPSIHVYSVSHYWDPEDELGCRWDDRELGIPWPVSSARVSERDASLPSLSELLTELDAHQPI